MKTSKQSLVEENMMPRMTEAENTTPSEIISDLVRERIAVTA
jgi:hypothetical protein